MIIKYLLKTRTGIKRWVLLGFIGVLLIVLGVLQVVNKRFYSTYNETFYVICICSGALLFFISLFSVFKTLYIIIKKGYLGISLDSTKIINLMYEKRLLVKGPKIVVIGGGTGLSTMLRGLKMFSSNITAIVTVADDGGGSGVLREDLGILPPGDIRNCILALADTEPIMEELLQYRFKDGRLKGQNFGNLFLAAMDGISDNFMDAVKKVSSVLAVKGKVLPVTLDNMRLKARLFNGEIIEGESNIPEAVMNSNSNIERMFIDPKNAKALDEAVEAIAEADAVILGPGSLYTSVIPNLLVKGIKEALHGTSALKLYVCNIMTQRGETDGYDVKDHIQAILKHSGKGIIDYVVANTGTISKELQDKYMEEEAKEVVIDEDDIKKLNVDIIKGDFIKIKNGYVRHDPEKLAAILMETIMEKKLLFDRKKIIEYFYLSERLKQNK